MSSNFSQYGWHKSAITLDLPSTKVLPKFHNCESATCKRNHFCCAATESHTYILQTMLRGIAAHPSAVRRRRGNRQQPAHVHQRDLPDACTAGKPGKRAMAKKGRRGRLGVGFAREDVFVFLEGREQVRCLGHIYCGRKAQVGNDDLSPLPSLPYLRLA